MQGRLLPMVGGRIQSFPGPGWEREFPLAAELGFASIELTIEMDSAETHPILDPQGRAAIRRLATEHRVALAGLGLDTAMEDPILAADPEARARSVARTVGLMEAAAETGLPMIELPLLNACGLGTPEALDALESVMAELLPRAEALGIDVLCEVDIAGPAVAAMLARIAHPRLGITYDSGNALWFGHDPDQDLPHYPAAIRNVHIKDIVPGQYTVPLGQGQVKFDRVFSHLAALGYGGGFILQAARQDDDLGAARDYLAFTRGLITAHLGG